jgi:hypothetical protein
MGIKAADRTVYVVSEVRLPLKRKALGAKKPDNPSRIQTAVSDPPTHENILESNAPRRLGSRNRCYAQDFVPKIRRCDLVRIRIEDPSVLEPDLERCRTVIALIIETSLYHPCPEIASNFDGSVRAK